MEFVLVPLLVLVFVLVDPLVFAPVLVLVEVPVPVAGAQLPEVALQHKRFVQVSPVEHPPIVSQ